MNPPHPSMTSPKPVLNKTELQGSQNEFKDRFFLGNTATPLTDNRPGFFWNDIVKLYDDHGPQAEGIYFTYGLEGSVFVPILELYKAGTGGKRTAVIPGTARKAASSGWVQVSDSVRDALESRYMDTVFVLGASGVRRPFKKATSLDPYGDVKGIHYPWSRLKDLFDHNPSEEPRKMVVSCISATMTDEQMQWKQEALGEYRHLLALHVAIHENGSWHDQLSDAPNTHQYALRAMDYGWVCPLTCPRERVSS